MKNKKMIFIVVAILIIFAATATTACAADININISASGLQQFIGPFKNLLQTTISYFMSFLQYLTGWIGQF